MFFVIGPPYHLETEMTEKVRTAKESLNERTSRDAKEERIASPDQLHLVSAKFSQGIQEGMGIVMPDEVLALQNVAGNEEVSGWIGGRKLPPQVQAKLIVGAVNDPYEQEADSIADKILRMPVSNEEQGTFSTEGQLILSAHPTNQETGHDGSGIQRSGEHQSGTKETHLYQYVMSEIQAARSYSHEEVDHQDRFEADREFTHQLEDRKGSGEPLPNRMISRLSPDHSPRYRVFGE